MHPLPVTFPTCSHSAPSASLPSPVPICSQASADLFLCETTHFNLALTLYFLHYAIRYVTKLYEEAQAAYKKMQATDRFMKGMVTKLLDTTVTVPKKDLGGIGEKGVALKEHMTAVKKRFGCMAQVMKSK